MEQPREAAQLTTSTGERAWALSEVAAAVARRLADTPRLWVRAELARVSARPNGSVYLELVEHETGAGRELARMSAVVLGWGGAGQRVRRSLERHGLSLMPGLHVCLQADIEYRMVPGAVQLTVCDIDAAHTVGAMAAGRERVLALLRAEGLLTANAALRTPTLPLRVGLVTSRGSDAEADVVRQLAGTGTTVVVADARTSGAGCDASVVDALAALARLHARGACAALDVVALVRGGGSKADLAPFDSEVIARAIATAPFPVWTGIGHDTDRSVADEVAAQAHPTPTACGAAIAALVASARERVRADAVRVTTSVERRLARADADLAATTSSVQRATGTALSRERARVDRLAARAAREVTILLDRRGAAVDAIGRTVAALDPARTLARGYAIIRDASGTAVLEPRRLRAGQALVAQLAGGSVAVRVADDAEQS